MSSEPASYAVAGVDIAAGERAVELIKASVKRTARPEVIGGLGGFAGLFRLDANRYRQPVLATSTDGVGTKTVIASAANRHNTIGVDLVAMVIDDLVVTGAEPLFMTDYIATGKVVPERIAEIVAGISEGCLLAGCALVGGETAEHPGVMDPDDYDLSGAGVGIVEADEMLGPERVRPGDALVAMGSSGLHANGYSLVRHVLFERAGLALDVAPPELSGRLLVDELLEPTRIYAQDCLALARAAEVHAFAHVTGGGLAGNLCRVLPADATALVERASWRPPEVFGLIERLGDVTIEQAELTFNRGVGMVAVVSQGAADDAVRLLTAWDVPAWILGSVVSGTAQRVRMLGVHPA